MMTEDFWMEVRANAAIAMLQKTKTLTCSADRHVRVYLDASHNRMMNASFETAAAILPKIEPFNKEPANILHPYIRTPQERAREAVELADALVEELKRKEADMNGHHDKVAME